MIFLLIIRIISVYCNNYLVLPRSFLINRTFFIPLCNFGFICVYNEFSHAYNFFSLSRTASYSLVKPHYTKYFQGWFLLEKKKNNWKSLKISLHHLHHFSKGLFLKSSNNILQLLILFLLYTKITENKHPYIIKK